MINCYKISWYAAAVDPDSVAADQGIHLDINLDIKKKNTNYLNQF